MISEDSRGPGNLSRFFIILSSFCLLDLVSWPIFFSYYLWVFADRSNFLNLEYLLDQHLRLGVDTFYSYGLLPVLIQHLLFGLFGRGYWPMVGCTVVVLILMAVYWSSLVRLLSNRWIYVLAVVALTPLLLWVNPNFPYSLVQLSMLFALLLLLEGRAEAALAVSTIGCFSVPSLPLILTALLAFYIAVDWWAAGNRSVSGLIRRLAPGALTYFLLAAGLSLFFSFKSVLATALPFLGVQYYYKSRNGGLADLIGFLHPAGHSFKYYVAYSIGAPAAWWIVSTVGLVIFAALASRAMIRNRRVDPRSAAILFCTILHLFFACFAYRNIDQHIIYDPIAATGMFLGIFTIPVPRWRNLALALFLCIGVMGEAAQVRQTLLAWKNTRPSALTANLYAEPEYGPEMAKILEIASTQKVLMMSYATGVHHYYPAIHSTDSWFLVAGLILPADRARILAGIQDADVVVEDTAHFPYFIDRDPDVQAQLRSMCLTDVMQDFQIWWRHPPDATACKVNPRPTHGSASPVAP